MKTDWLSELNANEVELDAGGITAVKQVRVKTHKQPIKKAAGRLDDKPWVEITGEAIDPEKGIRLSLDWNDEFIEYLKQNGITGADEEQVVQKYITMLYRELMEQMESSPTSEYE